MDINHVNDIINKLGFSTKQPLLKNNIYNLLYTLNDDCKSYLNYLPKEILRYMIDSYLYNSNVEIKVFKLPEDFLYDYFDEFESTIKTSQYYFIYGIASKSTISVIMENIKYNINFIGNLYKIVYCIKDSITIDNKYIVFSPIHLDNKFKGIYFMFVHNKSESKFKYDIFIAPILKFNDLYIVPLYKND